MTTNKTADLKLAIWLHWDRQSHPWIYVFVFVYDRPCTSLSFSIHTADRGCGKVWTCGLVDQPMGKLRTSKMWTPHDRTLNKRCAV